MRLYAQPLTHRFGSQLLGLLSETAIDRFEFGVAWARRSGTSLLKRGFKAFLGRGGVIRGTVGIDIENTSKEGLEDLLALEQEGDLETYVYHNERQDITYHPKVFLFESRRAANLTVGSNNLTHGGLVTNTEASLGIRCRKSAAIIRDAKAMLASWRDLADPRVKRLTSAFLVRLVSEGYVRTEEVLRQRRAANQSIGRPARGGRRLFGSVPVTTPSDLVAPSRRPNMSGTVLLMRVRVARGTQVQIPIRIASQPFFRGISAVRSRFGGKEYQLHRAHAHGKLNTIKLELPESRAIGDPVVRFERDGRVLLVSVFDSATAEGRVIMSALEDGRTSPSNPTVLTLPSNPRRSTWFRFV